VTPICMHCGEEIPARADVVWVGRDQPYHPKCAKARAALQKTKKE
jgi:hypothetical protein